MIEAPDLVSRRGFLKGLMAASALAAVAPTILVPFEAEAAPLPDRDPPVEMGDLWMRSGDEPWFFVGKTTEAQVWIEDDEYGVAFPMHRGITRRSALGRFEVAGDAESHRFIEHLMEGRAGAEFMVGHSHGVARAQCYLTRFEYIVGHFGGFVRNRIDVNITGPLEVAQ